MPTAPNESVELARQILRMYENAELLMLRKIADTLAADQDLSDDDWRIKKIRESRRVRQAIERILDDLAQGRDVTIEAIIEIAYEMGMEGIDQDKEEEGQKKEPEVRPVNIAHGRAMEVIARETLGLVEAAQLQVLRRINDVYAQAVRETIALMATGTMTRREATQMALDRMAQRGVTTFIDRRGRKRDLAAYAEMATRTGIAHAHVQGAINRMQEMGHDLVYVSNTPEECPICRKWEGKVLSVTGQTRGYPTVAQARRAGLWHPNCGHKLYAYFHGYSKTPKEGAANPEGYRQRQYQRHLERNLREWKKRLAVATTPEAKRKAQAKVNEWSKRIDQFTKKHGRRRLRYREVPRQGRLDADWSQFKELVKKDLRER